MLRRCSQAFVVVLAAAAAATACGRASGQNLARLEWTVGDLKREALVHVPLFAAGAPAPVVFAFHGHGGSMRNAARSFRMHELWPEAISVYMQGLPTVGALTDPEGRRRGWQRTIGADGDRDLAFFDAVWNTLKARWRIDESRVYAMGHSNGGGFTYLLWAARGDLFAAVAPSSAVPSPEARRGLRPKPVLHLAGEQDDLVKFAWQRPLMVRLRALNGCEAEGKPWTRFATWYPSAKDCPVVTYIHPGGHRLPADFGAVAVRFFQEHRRSGAPASRPESRPPGGDTRPAAPGEAETRASNRPDQGRD